MPQQKEYQYDLFVSYADANREWVEGFLLPALGLPAQRVFTKQSFRPGASVVGEFERGVTHSRYTVLVLSPAYLADEWSVLGEQLASHASVAEQRDRLIPLVLKSSTLPLRIDFRVRLDCTDEANWNPELARLRILLDQPEPAPERLPCPYPGMVPFSAKDARFFYGREAEIQGMLQRLRHQRFVFVIGPSGCGKSSLIFAGVLPKLTESSYFPQDFWMVRTMRPGPQPVQRLTETIGGDVTAPAPALASLLTTQPPAQRLLLVVDQFEELFTQAERAQQSQFLAALKALRAETSCALLITMRADFYPDLMNSDLWPVTPEQRLEIGPLRGEALRQAIHQPATDLGVYLEAGLLERLLADAADEPGALPLVQETMVLLWAEMQRRLLPLSAYERLGKDGRSGLAVAVETKADATLAELVDLQRAIARRIFLRLVQFGEGRADTRRRQSVSALWSAGDDPELFDRTLRHLTDNRLLTMSGEERKERKVDIAHEALITGWPTLRAWLTDQREAEQIRRRLEAKAGEWVRLGRASGGLLDAAELPEAERWLASATAHDLGHDEALSSLVGASRERLVQEEQRWKSLYEEAEGQRREAEHQRQLAVARQLAAQSQLTRNQQANLLERSVLLAVEAMRRFQSMEADQALRHGLALLPRRLASGTHGEAVRVVAFDPDGRYLATASGDGTARVWEAATGRQVAQIEHGGPVRAVTFSPDGQHLATASDDTASVWMASTGRQVAVMTHQDRVTAVAFSPDGQFLATASADSTAGLWIVSTGRQTQRLAHEGDVTAVAFSPNGAYLATAGLDWSARVWETSSGREVTRLMHEPDAANLEVGTGGRYLALGSRDVMTVAYSPNGAHLSTARSGDITARVWDAASGQELLRFAHGGDVYAVAFSPGGDYLASASTDHTARLWDLRTGHELARLSHENFVEAIVFNSDGQYVATGSADNTARLWEVPGGREIARMTHEGLVWSVTFSPDGSRLATGSEDLTSRVWEVADNREVLRVIHPEAASDVAFSPDGRYLATVSQHPIAHVWEIASGREVVHVTHDNLIDTVAFSPDGRHLASAGWDNTARVWDVSSGQEIARLQHEGWVRDVAFSPDGRLLATASNDTTARLWNVASGREVGRVEHGHEVWIVAFSPDGRYWAATGRGNSAGVLEAASGAEVVTVSHEDLVQGLVFISATAFATRSSDKTVRVWEIPTGQELARITHNDHVLALASSPDGAYLATGSADYAAYLWNISEAQQVGRMAHEKDVFAVAFTSDGRHLATGSGDRTVRVWDLPGGREVARMAHDDLVMDVAFSPDNRLLASASYDLTARIRLWQPDDLIAEACARLTRNLTAQEWRDYLGDEPYRRTCPNLPPGEGAQIQD